MEQNDYNHSKQLLREILHFLDFKVDTDQCTAEEIRKFADIATDQKSGTAMAHITAGMMSSPTTQ